LRRKGGEKSGTMRTTSPREGLGTTRNHREKKKKKGFVGK